MMRRHKPSLRQLYEGLSTPLLERRLAALSANPEPVGPYSAAAVITLIQVILANKKGYES